MRILSHRALVTAVALVVGVAALAVGASPAMGQERSKGSFFVYDTPDCTGGGNSSTVAPPFSVGGRMYPPNEPMQLFVTDQGTGLTYGPLAFSTDASGSFCLRVDAAPAGHWKIDVVQPGAGFTDSKVIEVQSAPPAPTTAPPPTTPPTTAPPTTAAPPTTTSPEPTDPSTTAPPTTAAPPPRSTISLSLLPWAIVPVPPPVDPAAPPTAAATSAAVTTLPSTGSGSSGTLVALSLTMLALGAVLIATTRRR